MNKKIFFGHNDIRFFYYRYKDSNIYSISILLATIVACIILIFAVIIPQAEVYFSITKEAEALNSKIKTVNDNIAFMNSIDRSQLGSQLQIATSALPTDKDFVGIINTITDAAVSSGVSVEDFSFNLNGSSPVNSVGAKTAQAGLIPIKISFDIKGSSDGGKKFLTDISEKIPLVEMISVNGESGALSINLYFYYKPLPQISFKEDEPIVSVSNSNQELIRKLSTWKTTTFNQDLTFPTGSSSATPLF